MCVNPWKCWNEFMDPYKQMCMDPNSCGCVYGTVCVCPHESEHTRMHVEAHMWCPSVFRHVHACTSVTVLELRGPMCA